MIDFERINNEALCNLESLLPELLPGGHIVSREYRCGDLGGGPGDSMGVNLDTCKWSDFADTAKGGDPVSLVAAVRRCDQGDAARWLEGWLGFDRPAPTSRARTTDKWATTPAPAPPTNILHPRNGKPSAVWEYRGVEGELLGMVCRFDQPDGDKEILPFTYGTDTAGKAGWRWKSWSTPRPLYGLDRLVQRHDAPVLIVEGEKTADAAQRLIPAVVAITWPGGCSSVGKADFTPLNGRRVAIWPDNDAPGQKAAEAAVSAALMAGAVEIFIIDVPAGYAKGWDLADAEVEGWTSKQVCEWIKNNRRKIEMAATMENRHPQEEEPKEGQKSGQEEAVDPVVMIQRLAGLSTVEYEQARKMAAEALGIRAPALDRAVKEARKNHSDSDLPFDEPDPWPVPVNPDQLLTDIAATIQRFIICSKEIANTVALWSTMTWFMDVVQIAPLAVITAPEKRCGKSQLLFLLGRLSARSITASSISPAALYRSIEKWNPTLLIDEVDACLKDNEELRGIINAGHTRDSAFTIRCVGDDHEPKRFNLWGAKALSGIGHVADTLMDRAVILELRRKLPHEEVDRLRYAEPDLFSNLRSKLARFADDYSEQVRQARPPLPASLNDRAQDNWEPLLAIAMVAGGHWLEIGTSAALKLSGSESAAQTIGTELLTDIKEIFEMKGTDRISTADLIRALCDDDEKVWSTYNRGNPIKPRQLANKLKGYGISSNTIRIGITTPKGFKREQFDEAFARYIPSSPLPSATPPQASNTVHPSVADKKTRCGNVAEEHDGNLLLSRGCCGVADRNPLENDSKVEVEI